MAYNRSRADQLLQPRRQKMHNGAAARAVVLAERKGEKQTGTWILAGLLLAGAAFLPSILKAESPVAQDRAEISEQVISLPKGEITVTVDRLNFTGSITDGKTSLPIETGYMPDPAAHYGDAVLLFVNSGGSACPGMFTWVTLDDKGLRQTEEFGTCSDLVEVRETAQGAVAVLPRMDGSGDSAFTFDGQTVTEADLGPEKAGVDNPRDAAAWADKRASELFSAAEMEPILLEIMSPEVLAELRLSSQLSGEGMVEDGDWLAGSGCRPHFCSEELGGVAINRLDGRVIAASWTSDKGGQTYGKIDGPLPKKLQDVIDGKF